MTLRLFHLDIPTTSIARYLDDPSDTEDICSWLDTVMGIEEIVSDDNERKVQKSVVRLCESVATEARRHSDDIRKLPAEEACETVLRLWKSQESIAQAVHRLVSLDLN